MDNNEQEEPKPETESDRRRRLKHELFESLNIYDINPRTIYQQLRGKWEKYSEDLLGRAEEALHHAYAVKQVMTYCNDGTDWGKNKVKVYMENFERLGNGEVMNTSPDGLPIAYYFLGVPYKDMESIVCFNENCTVEKDTLGFDLLFALQFSLTPIVECREFLKYQLKKSFNNNITEFADYLENICLEHEEFLAKKHEPFCKKFIKEMPPSQIETEVLKEVEKGNEVRNQSNVNKGDMTIAVKEIEKETTSMNKKPDQTIKDTRIQMEEVNSKPEIQASEKEIKNNFDDLKIEIVIEHFKNGLVEANYLNEADLLKFIQLAFEKKEIPRIKFHFKNVRTVGRIRKVFYLYYKEKAGHPHGEKLKYAALLGDYFEGYNTKTVITNFHKH